MLLPRQQNMYPVCQPNALASVVDRQCTAAEQGAEHETQRPAGHGQLL